MHTQGSKYRFKKNKPSWFLPLGEQKHRLCFSLPSLAIYCLLSLAWLLPLYPALSQSKRATLAKASRPPVHRFSAVPIPLVLYNDDHGFIYGLRLEGTYFHKNHIPYRLQVSGWYMHSSLNFKHYGTRIESYLRHDGLRLRLEMGQKEDPLANYYGYGNDQDLVSIRRTTGTRGTSVIPVGANLVREELTDLAIKDSQNRYYDYEYKNLYSNITIEDWIWKLPFKWFLGFSTNHYQLRSLYQKLEPSEREGNSYGYVDVAQDLGYDAIVSGLPKNVNFLRLALGYDSRDRKRGHNPSSAIVADLHYEVTGSWTGSDYAYSNIAFSWRHYIALFPSFWRKVDFGLGTGMESVLMYRFVLRSTFGEAPFFEAGKTRTMTESIDGLGGTNGLRGYPANQFIDKFMTLAGLELRHTLLKTNLLGGLDLQFRFFYDIGRVAPSAAEWEFKDFHQAYGPGFTVIWTQNTVLTATFGFSQHERFFSFLLNHSL